MASNANSSHIELVSSHVFNVFNVPELFTMIFKWLLDHPFHSPHHIFYPWDFHHPRHIRDALSFSKVNRTIRSYSLALIYSSIALCIFRKDESEEYASQDSESDSESEDYGDKFYHIALFNALLVEELGLNCRILRLEFTANESSKSQNDLFEKLLTLSSRFPNVTKLELRIIRQGQWKPDVQQLFRNYIDKMTQLTKLHIDIWDIAISNELISILNKSQKLEELSFGWYGNEKLPETLHHTGCFKSLSLNTDWIYHYPSYNFDIISWPKRLECLTLTIIPQMPSYRKAVLMHRTSLERLSLKFRKFKSTTRSRLLLSSFSEFPRLQQLSLLGWMPHASKSEEFSNIISTAPNLKHIIWEPQYGIKKSYSDFWKNAVYFLQRKGSSLEKIDIIYKSHEDWESYQEIYEEMMEDINIKSLNIEIALSYLN